MSKYSIIVAGCGNMASTWLEYIIQRDDAELVALVDINIKNAEKMMNKYSLNCATFTNIHDAIASTNANIIFDITIPSSHNSIVTAGIQAGCFVLGEKPMANTMLEVNEIIDTVESDNGFYAVMQNRRFLKNIRAFKELLSNDIIGDIGYIGADFFLGPHFGGFRDIMDSPLLLDMAIHTFDQARFLINAKPMSVYCHEYNPKGSWYKGNASAICIFEFDNGCVFCYRGSWCSEGVNTAWESEWRIQGSKGTAIWDGMNEPFAEVVNDSPKEKICQVRPEYTWQGREGHFGCLDEMFNAIEEKRNAETDCRDNRYSMSMVFNAIRSAKENKKIYLKHL